MEIPAYQDSGRENDISKSALISPLINSDEETP